MGFRFVNIYTKAKLLCLFYYFCTLCPSLSPQMCRSCTFVLFYCAMLRGVRIFIGLTRHVNRVTSLLNNANITFTARRGS